MRYKPRRFMKRYVKQVCSDCSAQVCSLPSGAAQRVMDHWQNSKVGSTLPIPKIDFEKIIHGPFSASLLLVIMALTTFLGISLIALDAQLVASPPSHWSKREVTTDDEIKFESGMNLASVTNLVMLPADDSFDAGEEDSWFTTGEVQGSLDVEFEIIEPVAHNTGRSLLALSDGRPVLATAGSIKRIPLMAEADYSDKYTALDQYRIPGVVQGLDSVDSLLADFNDEAATQAPQALDFVMLAQAPQWGRGIYGTEVFTGPKRHWMGAILPNADATQEVCLSDRVLTANYLFGLRRKEEQRSRYIVKKASQYKHYVERYSKSYSISPSLVYGIMRVESAFNPVAISPANALGLMQVVPHTAGGEVYAYLNGKVGIPEASTLFNPEMNIRYGTTYLHLLGNRHFKEVKDVRSREMCMIAAYNGGPGAVYRAFGNKDRSTIMAEINSMTREQLFEKLVRDLPHPETRDYLPRVLSARSQFANGVF